VDPDPNTLPDALDGHDKTGDIITIALVVATLLGAFTAWLQVHALFAHDEAAVRAEEWTVLASAQRSRANLAEQLQLERSWQSQRNRIGSERSAARRLFGRGDPTLLALETKQWRKRAQRATLESARLAKKNVAEQREIEVARRDSFPGIDPSQGTTAPCEWKPDHVQASTLGASAGRGPPARFASDSWREAYRMEGLRSGAAETAVRAEEQFTRYTGSLAAIAVALFLFGYALTKYGHRYRRIFAVIASVLTLVSVGLSANAYLHPPEKPPPTAAAAYADGRIAAQEGRFPAALADFACATRLNPRFAAAFLQRGIVLTQRGMPRDLAVINESLAKSDNLRKALKYGRRARQLDPEDPLALSQIATALYVFGLRERDPDQLARALSLDRQMAVALRDDPIPVFNAGTTLLALGRPWRASYRQAGRLMRDSAEPLAYVGGALTDLDYLGASGLWPGIRATTEAAKQEVVALASGLPAPSGRSARASLSDVRLSVTPESVRFSFAAKDFRPARDQLFAAWYREEKRGWQELQYLPGYVGQPVKSGGHYGARIWPVWSNSASSCLQKGRYRVELYVNGRLAQAGRMPIEIVRFPPLKHSFLSDLNLGLCHPRGDWHRIAHRTAGLIDGLERQAGGGREVVAAFDLSASSAGDATQVAATVLKHFTPPLPGAVEATGRPSWSLPIGPSTMATATAYSYPGGEMVLATAKTPIGRKLAIAVFGPPSLFAPTPRSPIPAGETMLSSLFTYDVQPLGE
jgi:tetratricopeptide (TPR) repeat protein